MNVQCGQDSERILPFLSYMSNKLNVDVNMKKYFLGDACISILATHVKQASVSLTLRPELLLEDRLYNQPNSRLNDTIPNDGNAQRAFFPAAGFVNVYPLDRAWPIALQAEFFAQFCYVFLQFLFKPLDALTIRPGAATIPFDGLPDSIKVFSVGILCLSG